jgi:hypothetical protein
MNSCAAHNSRKNDAQRFTTKKKSALPMKLNAVASQFDLIVSSSQQHCIITPHFSRH